jgi:signal transduction histidine kinase
VNKRTRRLGLATVAAIVACAVGFGVFAALHREALEAREQTAAARRALSVVEGVVSQSLDELRERESVRPFDHYNEVYVPEGVLAASDALAPSPLSSAPSDPRLRGFVQINPDGTLTLPFDRTRPDVAAALRAQVAMPAFDPLRQLTRPPTGPLVARVTALEGGEQNAAPSMTGPQGLSSLTRRPQARAKQKPTDIAEQQRYGEAQQGRDEPPQNAQQRVDDLDDPDRKGLVQQLNMASSNVYSQLQAAEPQPLQRAAIAGNQKLPNVKRQDVAWDDNELSKLGTKTKMGKAALDNVYQEKQAKKQAKKQAPKQAPKPQAKESAPLVDPALDQKATTTTTTATAAAPVVSYTPMVFDELDDGTPVMHRTVTSATDGAQTVQVVVLDREGLRTWLWSIVTRRVDEIALSKRNPEDVARLVRDTESAACSVRGKIAADVDNTELCFAPITPSGRGRLEAAVLVTLLVLVLVVLMLWERAAERAHALAQQRAAFVSAVSHELRTPLTTLRMYAELLRDGLVTDPEKAHRFHRDMAQESVRLSHLVENVLEAQRLEEGRRPLRLTSCDVGSLVAEVTNGQRPLVEQRGFVLNVDVADDDDLVGAVDRQACEQMVVNLIENAVKYAADGSAKQIDVSVRRDGDTAVVVVADHGPGIPAHERERVFQRFARVERPGEEHVAGTGLGLALVRELAMVHGGSARVLPTSEGCAVEVRLPLRHHEA